MTIRRIVFGLLDWLDGRPYRISVVYLGFLTLSFVPLVLRVGNLFQLWWNPFPKFSETQVLVLGYLYDKLLLVALLTGVAMCVAPVISLLLGRFRAAAKMFAGMFLALLLTAIVFFRAGSFVFCFSAEMDETEAAMRYREAE